MFLSSDGNRVFITTILPDKGTYVFRRDRNSWVQETLFKFPILGISADAKMCVVDYHGNFSQVIDVDSPGVKVYIRNENYWMEQPQFRSLPLNWKVDSIQHGRISADGKTIILASENKNKILSILQLNNPILDTTIDVSEVDSDFRAIYRSYDGVYYRDIQISENGDRIVMIALAGKFLEPIKYVLATYSKQNGKWSFDTAAKMSFAIQHGMYLFNNGN